MTHLQIVVKLIGSIDPIGETNADNKRFENLKVMCDLVEELIKGIDHVVSVHKDSYEFSRKRAADYAHNFLTNRLGLL